MKFGLGGIRKLLNACGDPHRQFPSIHVAGTNGKGSTASMLAAMFTAAGYNTGLYTSPHLVDFRERIRVNGRLIPAHAVVRLLKNIQKEVQRNNATFFEAVTAIAFRYFADSNLDIAIVETGLGGRLDATNVLRPLVSVITSIGLEHTEILGKSIRSIAREKAGIIKEGTPCVCGSEVPEAEDVIESVCGRRGAQFISIRDCRISVTQSTIEGSLARFDLPKKRYARLRISLPGDVQARNAAVALLAAGEASRIGSLRIPERAVRRGLADIQGYSGLRGRMSVLRRNPLVIADVAHNPDATSALADSLLKLGIPRARLVFGVVKDKDYVSMIRSVKEIAEAAIVVTPKTGRGRPAATLVREFRLNSIPARASSSVARGIDAALKEHRATPIVITGSHFVVGEALAHLEGRKYLTINQ